MTTDGSPVKTDDAVTLIDYHYDLDAAFAAKQFQALTAEEKAQIPTLKKNIDALSCAVSENTKATVYRLPSNVVVTEKSKEPDETECLRIKLLPASTKPVAESSDYGMPPTNPAEQTALVKKVAEIHYPTPKPKVEVLKAPTLGSVFHQVSAAPQPSAPEHAAGTFKFGGTGSTQ